MGPQDSLPSRDGNLQRDPAQELVFVWVPRRTLPVRRPAYATAFMTRRRVPPARVNGIRALPPRIDQYGDFASAEIDLIDHG